jgi:hypothetical protein
VDDLDATLDGLERRLAALQAELDAPERAPVAMPAAGAGDPLQAFGEHLRAAVAELVEAWDRASAQAGGGAATTSFAEELALEVHTDLAGLCALCVALRAVEGVAALDLRAYAGGHAAIDVTLDRPVALVAEVRRVGGPPLAVLEARPGRLVAEVGAGPPGAGAARR